MAWITAAEALAALGVRPQTLYANVSRGRIRAKPDPKDSRRSLYNSDDVKRLAARGAGRRSSATVATQAIGWGDPVLPSAISTVARGRLWYRGQDAAALSDTATLEQTAGLLWEVDSVSFARGAAGRKVMVADLSPLQAGFAVLARHAGAGLPARGRSRAILAAEAADLIGEVAAAMLRSNKAGSEPLHLRMASAWGVPSAAGILRRAMVLLADHELNASTFAARVTASTGAPLASSLLAGLTALSGPLHGGMSAAVQNLFESAHRIGAENAIRKILAQGDFLPGFGHPLYPHGDPRAIALLESFPQQPVHAELAKAAEALTGEPPNIDFAMTALADSLGLPAAAPVITFAIARSVGWAAHIMEQLATGSLIRPRARYTGPPLAAG